MYKRLEMSVDEYLHEVTKQLGSLPAERRDEELREMRQHLDEAAAKSREQGLSEEQAVAAALTRFGTPEEAAENVIWAWRHSVRKVWSRFSVRFICLWGGWYIIFFCITPHPIMAHPHFLNALLLWKLLFGFTFFLPLLLALPLYLPRKYQPAWLYRCLTNGPLANIR